MRKSTSLPNHPELWGGAGRAELARSEGGRPPTCSTGAPRDASVLGDRHMHLELRTDPAAAPPSGPILLVEDEEVLAGAICYRLQREGFEAVFAVNGLRGLDLFRERAPRLVILDLTLPRISGLDLCRIMREESTAPIIILTAKDTEADKVAGLGMGADDYVTKPFSILELVSRVRAHLRRVRRSARPIEDAGLVAGPVHMDIQRHEVHLRGRQVELPPKEFALLETLLRRADRLATRQTLIWEVWGPEYMGDTRTLDVHISRLRSKIEEDPGNPRLVVTVRGLGYKLQA